MQMVSTQPAVAGILNGLLTTEQVMAELDCCRSTLLRLEKRGLPLVRVGGKKLYDPAAIRAWVFGKAA